MDTNLNRRTHNTNLDDGVSRSVGNLAKVHKKYEQSPLSCVRVCVSFVVFLCVLFSCFNKCRVKCRLPSFMPIAESCRVICRLPSKMPSKKFARENAKK